MSEHLARILRLRGLVGSAEVRACDLCGRPSDRLMCKACRAEDEARWLAQAADRDRTAARIIQRARQEQRLSDIDRRWLFENGDGQWVTWLETSWRSQDKPRRRER